MSDSYERMKAQKDEILARQASGALKALEHIWNIASYPSRTYEENRAVYEGLRNWIEQHAAPARTDVTEAETPTVKALEKEAVQMILGLAGTPWRGWLGRKQLEKTFVDFANRWYSANRNFEEALKALRGEKS